MVLHERKGRIMEKSKKLKRVRMCKRCKEFVEVDSAGKIKPHKCLTRGNDEISY